VSPLCARRAPRLRASVTNVPIAPAVVALRHTARLRVLPVHLEAVAALVGRVASHLIGFPVAARHGAQCENDRQRGRWASTTQSLYVINGIITNRLCSTNQSRVLHESDSDQSTRKVTMQPSQHVQPTLEIDGNATEVSHATPETCMSRQSVRGIL